MAERGGFEPPVHLLGIHTISSRAPSASRTSLREGFPLLPYNKVSVPQDSIPLYPAYIQWRCRKSWGSLSHHFPANREIYRVFDLNITLNLVKFPFSSAIPYGKEKLIKFRTGKNRELQVDLDLPHMEIFYSSATPIALNELQAYWGSPNQHPTHPFRTRLIVKQLIIQHDN